VLLAADGTPKVADFGLAKRLDGESGLSQTGQVMGTPSYMPPEQAAGRVREVGPASDVYSLGAILYELLTGRPPFRGPTAVETVRQVLSEEPVPPRRLQSRVPADLETVCLKCLEKAAGRRYGTASELAADLGRYLAGEPVRARPVGAPERLAKWARRKPALAAAYGLLAVLLLVGGGGGGATWLWLGAVAAQRRAETAEGEAKQARDALQGALQREQEAKRQLTRYAYADHVRLCSRRGSGATIGYETQTLS
jgi:hypothetical protein